MLFLLFLYPVCLSRPCGKVRRQQVDQQQLLVGVFIEASDQELASALSEIQKLDNLQELSVAQSVSLADVSRNLIASHPVTADLTKRVRSRKKGNGKAAFWKLRTSKNTKNFFLPCSRLTP